MPKHGKCPAKIDAVTGVNAMPKKMVKKFLRGHYAPRSPAPAGGMGVSKIFTIHNSLIIRHLRVYNYTFVIL